MDKAGVIKSLKVLVENELVRNLNLIKESSYGILSSAAKRKEINRFKAERIKDGYPLLSDKEIDIIIEYVLLQKELKTNEKDIKRIDGDER